MRLFLLSILFIFSISIYAFAEPFPLTRISREEGFKFRDQKKCDIHLSFGSYGSGIPSKEIKLIQKILASPKWLLEVYTWHWGKEGEFDYCILTKNAEELFSQLKKVIPEYSKNGYTTLTSKSGKVWKTTWPK